ncbi:MAG TPA: TetR/AcrR family transcriptional regulator [Gaiellaceae bacterium]|nr:TetR/AcrR family transcriptional regulator [Gaiellaceae bacterium]
MPDTDARIAALAADLFHRQGITSTGVDALSKAAGISKRTLYERFGSKDGLVVAAYDSLDLPVFLMLTAPAEAASDDPREQLDGLFAQLEAMVQLPEFRGCPFVNAASELTDADHPAHAVVRRHKDRLRRWVLKRARAAGAESPEQLSRQLMLLFAGAQSQALVERSPKPVRDARVMARTLVAAAIQQVRRPTERGRTLR